MFQDTNIQYRTTSSQRSNVWLKGKDPINVDNDAGTVFQTAGSYSGSARIGPVPIASFEVNNFPVHNDVWVS